MIARRVANSWIIASRVDTSWNVVNGVRECSVLLNAAQYCYEPASLNANIDEPHLIKWSLNSLRRGESHVSELSLTSPPLNPTDDSTFPVAN
jgi:hypothetical protein